MEMKDPVEVETIHSSLKNSNFTLIEFIDSSYMQFFFDVRYYIYFQSQNIFSIQLWKVKIKLGPPEIKTEIFSI